MEKTAKYMVCVDRGESSRTALHFACKKAIKSGGSVEMLHIIPPADMQNIFGVMEKVRAEQRQEAEVMTRSLGESAFQYSGVTPSVKIRVGRPGEEIINAALEDTSVNMLVLGASPESAKHGSLIQWLAGKLGDRLLVPIMLVPGNLTDLQIDELS